MRYGILLLLVMVADWIVPVQAQEPDGGALCTPACVYLPSIVTPLPAYSWAPSIRFVWDSTSGVVVKSARAVLRSYAPPMVIVGEVENHTGVPLRNVKVVARWNNAVGFQEDYGYVMRDVLEPDARAPFGIGVTFPFPSNAHIVLTTEYATDPLPDYRSVTVVSTNIRYNQGLELSGVVRNDHEHTVTGIALDVTFYDAAGDVVDVAGSGPLRCEWWENCPSAPPPPLPLRTLAPGASAPYAIPTYKSSPPYTSFAIVAQGYVAP